MKVNPNSPTLSHNNVFGKLESKIPIRLYVAIQIFSSMSSIGDTQKNREISADMSLELADYLIKKHNESYGDIHNDQYDEFRNKDHDSDNNGEFE